MTGSVSLIGNGVSIEGTVSLTQVSTALFAFKVSLLGTVSITGVVPAPPPPFSGQFLLANGVDFLLLANGMDELLLAGPP